MSKNQLVAIFWGFINAFHAYGGEAEGPRQSTGIISYANVMQWLFGLILVLALFGVFVWLLRKSGTLAIESKSELAVLSAVSLGIREKLVLVKVGEKQLLLGITPGRVEKLLELEGDSRLFQNQAESGNSGLFAKKLQQILQSKADA